MSGRRSGRSIVLGICVLAFALLLAMLGTAAVNARSTRPVEARGASAREVAPWRWSANGAQLSFLDSRPAVGMPRMNYHGFATRSSLGGLSKRPGEGTTSNSILTALTSAPASPDHGHNSTPARTISHRFVATKPGAGTAGEVAGVGKPSGTPDFTNGATSPGEGWQWRGPDAAGGERGAWYKPETGETLHPDLSHGVGGGAEGPHYDWRDPAGKFHRVYPDGRIVNR